jgi:aspartyl-tRNA(Asn)/glutamyl-tRNA(Gln) amidotransferase subunit A
VRDVAILFDALAGADPNDPTSVSAPAPPRAAAALADARASDAVVRGLRVGVPDRYFSDGLDPEAAAAYQDALRALGDLGCRVENIRLPELFDAAMDAHELIHHTEAAAVHADTYRARPDDYGHKLRAIIEAGFHVPAPSYVRAQQIRTLLIEGMRALMGDVDVIATPSAPGPAPAGLASTGSPVYNRPFSFLGFPSLTVPCGFTKAGLPLGIQFGGRPFEEVTLLTLAAAYEGATRWGERMPAL